MRGEPQVLAGASHAPFEPPVGLGQQKAVSLVEIRRAMVPEAILAVRQIHHVESASVVEADLGTVRRRKAVTIAACGDGIYAGKGHVTALVVGQAVFGGTESTDTDKATLCSQASVVQLSQVTPRPG